MALTVGRAAALVVVGGVLIAPALVVMGINGCPCPGGLEWLMFIGFVPLGIGITKLVMLSAIAYQEGRKSEFKNKS